jgi:hypothetical protein
MGHVKGPRPSGLGLGDAFQLTLAAQIRLEFGEHAQHVQKALAGSRTGIDRLLRRLERRALGAHGPDDILKVADAPGQPVNAGDHEHVAGPEEFEHGP